MGRKLEGIHIAHSVNAVAEKLKSVILLRGMKYIFILDLFDRVGILEVKWVRLRNTGVILYGELLPTDIGVEDLEFVGES